jgi:predicted transcriptional regulator YdeE
METYFLKDNIKLICVNAISFPDGITDAFDRLHEVIGAAHGRKIYGISHGTENGKTIYKAAVEQLNDHEAAELKLEEFVVKSGEYVGARIINYPDHLESIGKTFEKLLANPRLDPNGCCV